MRKGLITTLLVIIVLVPACTLSAPNRDAPNATPIVAETVAAPTDSIPTGATATLPSSAETVSPLPSSTPGMPSTQISPTLAPTEAPLPVIRFYMQPGTPTRMANFVEPESGCDWMGMAGQVFDLNGDPLAGAVIEVGGFLDGLPIQQIALTGSSSAIGPGGYIIELSNRPVPSDGTLWFQLLDQQGVPKTGRILLTTSGLCEENLILINLIEATPITNLVRLPVVMKSAP